MSVSWVSLSVQPVLVFVFVSKYPGAGASNCFYLAFWALGQPLTIYLHRGWVAIILVHFGSLFNHGVFQHYSLHSFYSYVPSLSLKIMLYVPPYTLPIHFLCLTWSHFCTYAYYL